jgi:predicted  nucleic acid-binding Zn-ribbon protein
MPYVTIRNAIEQHRGLGPLEIELYTVECWERDRQELNDELATLRGQLAKSRNECRLLRDELWELREQVRRNLESVAEDCGIVL